MSDEQNSAKLNTSDKPPTEDEEDEEDPYDTRIEKTGCAQYHIALQECFADHKDWRKCQDEMLAFKKCMQEQQQRKGKELENSATDSPYF